MIIWGSMAKSGIAATDQRMYCSGCGDERGFTVFVDYTVRHLYYLFRLITGKNYSVTCNSCGRSERGMVKDIEPNLARSPYSGFDRFGWAIGVGLIIALVIAAVLAGRQNDAENIQFAAAPRVGDLYVMNLAKGAANPERPQMFTLGRLTRVAGGEVSIELGRMYFEQENGVRDDISQFKYRQADYFGSDVGTIPVANIAAMQRDGMLIDIERN